MEGGALPRRFNHIEARRTLRVAGWALERPEIQQLSRRVDSRPETPLRLFPWKLAVCHGIEHTWGAYDDDDIRLGMRRNACYIVLLAFDLFSTSLLPKAVGVTASHGGNAQVLTQNTSRDLTIICMFLIYLEIDIR